MKKVILPIFVPHMGCPHQCVFCNQFHITGQWQAPKLDDLRKKVEEWKVSSGQVPELAFYGGSFTAIETAMQETLLERAAVLKAQGHISAIRLSTRPDALGDEVLARLHFYEVDTVEIGVQSLDDDVLAASQRGHTAKQAMDAIVRVKDAGFRCGAQMMMALPADTPEKSLATGRQLIALKPDFVRIYPTAVIRDTALATAYEQGDYVPWAFDVLLETAAKLWMQFSEATIPVIRIGLQAEENLSAGEVLAGGYHPALGELVMARVFRKRMAALLASPEHSSVTFAVAPQRLSQAIGQHRDNVAFLSRLAGQSVTVIADPTLQDTVIERR
ncbi:MAG: radical SAM protein [Peptococcaceae bacterium]|nr:radical SAM protein [Peptococcaceae bacterium]